MQTAKGKKKKTKEDYDFLPGKELGKGSYGCVKLALDKTNGQKYAIKIMSKKAIFEYSNKENLKREINIQRNINHPHITRLYNYFEDNENVYLVLEYAENGSLFHYLRRKKKFTEDEAFIYFFQTCLGIDYLHKKKVIHRDLKPENLLLDAECNVKLCDFGWSAEDFGKRSTFCGTIDYMAPEMIKNQPHDHRLDIWCLGVLLYEMFHGYAPFKGKSDQEKCANIVKTTTNLGFDSAISSDAVDLVRKILRPAPVDRISMDGIFRHPWMKRFEKFYNIDIGTYIAPLDEDEQKLSLGSQNVTIAGTSVGNKIIYVDDSSPYKVSENKYYQTTKPAETTTDSYGNRKIVENTKKTGYASTSQAYDNKYDGGVYKTPESKPHFSFGESSTTDTHPSTDLYIYQSKTDESDFRARDRNRRKLQTNMNTSSNKSLLNDITYKKPDRSASQDYSRYPGALQQGGAKTRFAKNYNITEDIDEDNSRVSLTSKKNREIEKKFSNMEDEDLSFFDKILMKFGCITRERDNKKKFEK